MSIIAVLLLSTTFTVFAADDDKPSVADKALRYTIGDSEEREALELDSQKNNIVNFTLDMEDDSNWIADYIEVGIFEAKRSNPNEYSMMQRVDGSGEEMKILVPLDGLQVHINLGNSSNYRTGARYQIAYRVHMYSIDDKSLTAWNVTSDCIDPDATEEGNIGWTLLTMDGEKFVLYTNSDPKGTFEYLVKSEDAYFTPPSPWDATSGDAVESGLTPETCSWQVSNPYATEMRLYTNNFKTQGTSTSTWKDWLRVYGRNNVYYYMNSPSVVDNKNPASAKVLKSTSKTPSGSTSASTNGGWIPLRESGNEASTNGWVISYNSDANSKKFSVNRIEYRVPYEDITASEIEQGNWNKSNGRIQGYFKLTDEDEGDLLGMRVLCEGSNGEIMDLDTGCNIVPGTLYELNIDLGKYGIDDEDCIYTVTYEVYDDNGGESVINSDKIDTLEIKMISEESITVERSEVSGASEIDYWKKDDEYKEYEITVSDGIKSDIRGIKQAYIQYGIARAITDEYTNARFVTQPFITYDNFNDLGPYCAGLFNSYVSGNKIYASAFTGNYLYTVCSEAQHVDIKPIMLEEANNSRLFGAVVYANDEYGNLVTSVQNDTDQLIKIDNNKPYKVDYSLSIKRNGVSQSGVYRTTGNYQTFLKSALNWITPDEYTNGTGLAEAYDNTNGETSGIKQISYLMWKMTPEEVNAYAISGGALDLYVKSVVNGKNSYTLNGKTVPEYKYDWYRFDTGDESLPIEPDAGVYKIDGLVTDGAGNESGLIEEEEIFLAIDGKAPVIDIEDVSDAIRIETNSEVLANNPGVDYVSKWLDGVEDCKFDIKVIDEGTVDGYYADVSNVKAVEFGISDSTIFNGIWNNATSNGDNTYRIDASSVNAGVKYLHIRAIDNAGNVARKTIKIKLNSPMTLTEIVVDETSKDGIYATLEESLAPNGIKTFIVRKNTSYTNFGARIADADATDKALMKYKFTSNDTNEEIVGGSEILPGPFNAVGGNYNIFTVVYERLTEPGISLPDGIYTLTVDITDVKDDEDYRGIVDFADGYILGDGYGNDVLNPETKTASVQIVIKRTQPPAPTFNITGDNISKDVEIIYPTETIPSLDCPELNALIVRRYKTVSESAPVGVWNDYITPILGITERTTITAEYIDCAGNKSNASVIVLTDDIDGNNEEVSINPGGTDVKVDENRSSNTYYIGTRKKNDAGINNSEVFKFID